MSRQPPPHRARPPLALVGAVLLAHVLLLRPAPPRATPAPAPRAAPLWLRAIPAPAATPAVTPVASAGATPPAPGRATSPAGTARTPAVTAPSPRRLTPLARASAATPPPRSETDGRQTPAVPAAPAVAVAAPVRLADTVTLHYRVSGLARGLPLQADAQLRWQREGSHYEAEWTLQLPPIGTRRQHSTGRVTPAGLVPERYAERQRGERAAHFDAEGGRIRFSANTPDTTLQAGAQDRLSTLLQLGGLIAADPPRYPPGSQIVLQTAGAREAADWRWEVLDDEVLQLDGQAVPCVRLQRAPRHEYDTRIELWLARALHYLPARLRVTQASGDVADQQLSSLPTPR